MTDQFFTQKTCDRCGRVLTARIMSRFNTDCICLECAEAEKQLPDYQKAVKAELEEILKGNLNFGGIGLPEKKEGGDQ